MTGLNPNRTILLVIDMQNDFYGEGGNTEARGKSIQHMQSLPGLVNHFVPQLRDLGVKVVFTRFVYDPLRSPGNYSEIVRSAKKNNWLCLDGSPGAELDGVDVAKDDVVMEKLTYDSFAGTPLLQMARSWDTQNIVLVGVRTEICILSTASRAFAEGFRTIILSDLIGTQDDRMGMTSVLLDALSYTSHVMTSDQLLEELA